MRLNSKLLVLIINFFLGFFWAVSVIGAGWGLFSNFHIGLLYALSSMIIWAIPGVFGVLLIEVFLSTLERTEESKRQTKLLEKILQSLEESR